MSALVADFTDADILAGTPFMTSNDISIRPAKGQIIIGDQSEVVLYDSRIRSERATARLITSFDVKVPCRSVILPGEALTVDVPQFLAIFLGKLTWFLILLVALPSCVTTILVISANSSRSFVSVLLGLYQWMIS